MGARGRASPCSTLMPGTHCPAHGSSVPALTGQRSPCLQPRPRNEKPRKQLPSGDTGHAESDGGPGRGGRGWGGEATTRPGTWDEWEVTHESMAKVASVTARQSTDSEQPT